MPINTTVSRANIVYLKRRPKLSDTPVIPTTTASNSLVLTAPNAVLAPEKPSKPTVSGKIALSFTEKPVVRLNKRQSAMGSLVITNAASFAWDTGLKSGEETPTQPNANIPAFGNRKVVEFYKNEVVLSLRYFAQLKRLIVAANSGIMEIKLYDGSTIVVDSDNGKNVIYISRINNILEIRLEKLTGTVAETFSVKSSL